uniref:Cyclin-like domain-containing protein n=1 Tax=Odontella aurita TaxID=265563 RepID=A0A7S4JSK0_9STRA|mmetsp:Transcript_53264/g.159469  ORF Transcript_53264/g.159469 Transcript_53264/m.159469 type:complete len:323 (+) Transcript_53264:60-1028(+)|eukprot:CAMPEP_0113566668 /NCGR_PEP_ID=MMETSP0015_2-20120614/22851_1 /TAXON_ID=2838 /ORGANISM="Odontella" /LENGTH=322 /DNA_ID=CAMNT_0000468983 /DNA_START=69 /DNA_END=1037 /DNA_ORIENTATION=- /assembly_acc=CAM_ASM_000160
MSSSQIHDLPERFEVMRRQDETVYNCEDYLAPEFQQRLRSQQHPAVSALVADPISSLSSVTSASSSSSGRGLDLEWRDKIVNWCYQVVDHFNFSREVVVVAMSYLDRYLCKKYVNKRTFQLVAMSSLHLACKLLDQKKLRMSSLLELSRGYFKAEHMIAMEESILSKLGYLVHPPTQLCFVRHLFLLLPHNCCSPHVRHGMEEAAKFMIELSVFRYDLVTVRKSSVGLAAILNAFEDVDEYRFTAQARQHFFDYVRHYAGLDPENDEVRYCRETLKQLYLEKDPEEPETLADSSRDSTVSPVSVAAFGAYDGQHHQTQSGFC